MKDETGPDQGPGSERPDDGPADPAYWERALTAAGAGSATASYLIQDPDVSAAVASGRPARVYAAFTRKLAAARSEADRTALAALLANRRLFLEPVSSGPAMWTLNGCGTRCYGSAERADDGTYVTTLFVTAVFVPIWPLREYLVADAEKSGWYFLGKVPMSSSHRWWRRLALAAVVAAALLVGLLGWNRSTHDDVQFLNGLPFAVSVTMGPHEVRVEPGDRVSREFESGEYHVVARRADGGDVIEETDVVVPGGTDLVAYNVLGSAPLYLQVEAYAADDVPAAEAEARQSLESLAGRSWVTVDDVDHLFEETPDQIDMRRSERVATRLRADLWSAGTWLEASGHLANDGDMPRAAELARRVALLDPSDDTALDRAYGFTAAAGDAAATRAFLEAALEAAPDRVQPHRMYQTFMQEQGALEELRARYRAAYEADRTSAHAGYLCARIVPAAEALTIYESLLPLHPDDPWLLRGASWTYFQQGRFTEAVPLLESFLALRSDEAGYFVPMLARALVGAGRPQDALETVEALLSVDGLAGSNPWTLMSLYSSLRRLVPDVPFAKIEEHWRPFVEGEPGAVILAETAALGRDTENVDRLRAEVDDPESLRYCDLVLLSRSDPGAAAELALTAAPDTLKRMDDAAQIAIACELARTGHRERAEQVLGGLFPQSAEHVGMDEIDALPDVSALSEDLDVTLRAALLVAAARRTDDATTRAELLAEAQRLDVLRQVVPD